MDFTIPTTECTSQQVDSKRTQAQLSSMSHLGCHLRREPACMGTHLLVEMWNAPFSKLADANIIADALGRAGSPCAVSRSSSKDKDENSAKESTASKTSNDAIEVHVHQFTPYGVSGQANGPCVNILIHTWPERDYAAVDIFARARSDAYLVLEHMKEELEPDCVHVLELRRGQLLEMEDT